MTVTTLVLPGLWNSGPDHWQSHWERLDPSCVRVHQDAWESPRRDDWVQNLDRAVRRASGEVVILGHSTACALVAHWAGATTAGLLARVRGAFLVAPSDTEGANYPVGPTGFAPVPMQPLPFRSIVVASESDEYVTVERARSFAAAWHSEFVNIGAAGHINAASGYGAWLEGRALLRDFSAA